MDRPSRMLFPSVGTHVLSTTIHLLGVSVLAYLVSRRTTFVGNLPLRDISWPRICVLLILIDSWLFIFSSGILILGFGLEENNATCSTGILLCIIFYGSSKLFIYAFLLERIHVVWRPSPSSGRLECKPYLVCLAVLLGYGGIVGVLFYGRISYFGDNGVCYIGLKKLSSIALLTYDFLVNAVLTGLFLWPVVRSSTRNTRVWRLALRTLWSALLALTTSCVNILILTLMHGRQLGWVCLGSCGTDVIINALVIYWVTSKSPESHSRTPTVAGFVSKPEDPEPGRGDLTVKTSKVLFKLGNSRRSSPVGMTSMQIRVTTERVDEHGGSASESEYELQKIPPNQQMSPNEAHEEIRSPDSDE